MFICNIACSVLLAGRGRTEQVFNRVISGVQSFHLTRPRAPPPSGPVAGLESATEATLRFLGRILYPRGHQRPVGF
ncbi:hypothetical protein PoB_002106700 [Plakobranchus ocellatus]|uniref:Uncharacterized protein n=1 Tax=Plakobranchus ocellatus TaxID=259542 RepID=A0AAV3ZGW4_9GAST|nr:hypothetical protein PoB_002106700 [Plakobranchus ocellatus]